MRNHIKTIVASCTVIVVAFMTMAFINIDSKKIKLQGTYWRYVYEMRVLDGGNMKFETILHFTTKKDAVFTRISATDRYTSPRVKPDGTVEEVPATSTQKTENVSYKVSGKIITFTFADGTKIKYVCEGELLLLESGNREEKIFNKYNPKE